MSKTTNLDPEIARLILEQAEDARDERRSYCPRDSRTVSYSEDGGADNNPDDGVNPETGVDCSRDSLADPDAPRMEPAGPCHPLAGAGTPVDRPNLPEPDEDQWYSISALKKRFRLPEDKRTLAKRLGEVGGNPDNSGKSTIAHLRLIGALPRVVYPDVELIRSVLESYASRLDALQTRYYFDVQGPGGLLAVVQAQGEVIARLTERLNSLEGSSPTQKPDKG